MQIPISMFLSEVIMVFDKAFENLFFQRNMQQQQ